MVGAAEVEVLETEVTTNDEEVVKTAELLVIVEVIKVDEDEDNEDVEDTIELVAAADELAEDEEDEDGDEVLVADELEPATLRL